jgi:hypothetical protein
MAENIQSNISTGQAEDNFKLVDGIGPAVENRLHEAGVTTYSQLAGLKPKMMAEILNGMVGYSPKRIKEQDWSGQAYTLAKNVEPSSIEENHESINNSLHYASYTVELLLDRENKVRRTRVLHVQSNQETTWAGWDIGRLRGFLVDSGQLQIITVQEDAAISKSISSTKPLKIESSHSAPVLQGTTQIVETRLVNQAGHPLGALIPGNTPFEIQLVLDLSQVEMPKGECLDYNATLYMKKMGNTGRVITGEKNGSLDMAKSAVINVYNQPLAQGDFRMEALVILRPNSQPKHLKNQLMAMSESMVLHVI